MEINDLQKEKIKAIGEKYNLKLIILHGSYAKGEQKPGSDLDIAVVGKNHTDNDVFLSLHLELAGIFGNSRTRELDVKELKNPTPLFLYEATKDGILLFGNELDFLELQAYANRLYHDSKKLFELESKLAKRYQKYLNQKYA
jgi:uncharacterized protein